MGEFLMLLPRSERFTANSNGNPIVGRPFFNAGVQDAQLIAFPGLSTGSMVVSANTNMYSAALSYWQELYSSASQRDTCGENDSDPKDFLLGIKFGPRFAHLDDKVHITENLTSIATGNQFYLEDNFHTENSFLGGELGLNAQRQRGNFDLDLGLRLALGATHQELETYGLNSLTAGGVTTTTPGGFYAQTSNSGKWDRTRLSLIPALDAGIGYARPNGWRFSVTYILMYWTNVLRAAEEIDSTINPDFFNPPIVPTTGPNRPAPRFFESDYLAQGISFGVEKRW